MSKFEERAAARAAWPVVTTSLESDAPTRGPEDPSAAWYAVIELTREGYAVMETSPRVPTERSQWPSRLFRPGERRPDSNGL